MSRVGYVIVNEKECVCGVFQDGTKYYVKNADPDDMADVVQKRIVQRNVRRVILVCPTRVVMNFDAMLGHWYDYRSLVIVPDHTPLNMDTLLNSEGMQKHYKKLASQCKTSTTN